MSRLIHDQWLSRFLEKPAFNLRDSFDELSKDKFPSGVAFVGAKVPVNDVAGLVNLQRFGFCVIDLNVQLFQPVLSMHTDNTNIRIADPEDEIAVRSLARTAFKHNRFHRDPYIPDEIASRIKEEWVGNFFAGKRGEWMVVAEEDNTIVGFLQLLRKEDDTLIIDLIAVAQHCRSKGLAKAMISFASDSCGSQHAGIQVGTQIANTASLALYTDLGFRITSAAYVLHLHHKG